MADRLTGIEVFVEAMRLGGLSSAARVLHMSPAMAAKHLTALEARLGTLVHRTTRRLSLTEARAPPISTRPNACWPTCARPKQRPPPRAWQSKGCCG
jgi:hypothetical protein